jgi:8-oxo-dGTP pyrophosphatase MutT (NUDIX family)
MSVTIRAAGGVPVRVRAQAAEVLLVHRRRYDDWTFPKGKVEAGETDAECALREVEEETGLLCTLGEELPSTSYAVAAGTKVVRYWRLAVVAGVVVARAGEIDEARWVSGHDAGSLLTHAHDLPVLAAALAGV